MIIQILFLIVGLAVLVVGADWLVRGASSLAARMKVSPLVIGLTIVSFGTSAPELTVNIAAALNGSPDIAIGNVIGSNIANILLILGICAIISPLSVKSSTVWKEIPLAALGMFLIFVMGNDALFDGVGFNALTRTDGIALMALMVIFMYYIFGMAKRDKMSVESAKDEGVKLYGTWASVGLIVVGLAALVAGGQLLVDAAVQIAKQAGLSESLIGLTIVGIGTSLPELATSVVATLKKQDDIAVGNIVGSNIFNVFWILGLSSVITELPFNTAASIDVLVGLGATIILMAVMFIGKKHKLTRLEGIIFLTIYAAYILYVVNRG
jgi:cation:H+ antiporter